MNLRVALVRAEDRHNLSDQIRELESHANYPFGEDSFHIDHGTDYFKFFDRLGMVYYYCVFDRERIVAVGAGILRSVPEGNSSRQRKVWYLCDLKVHPEYRGKHLPLLIFRKALIPSLILSRRCYAVTMNSVGPSRVAGIFSRARFAALSTRGILNIYSLSHDDIIKHRSLIESHRGPVSFLQLSGIKDLVMSKTTLPIPLAHIQFGPLGVSGRADPIHGNSHMIASPVNDPLAIDLAKAGVVIDATATILHYRMAATDFKFILTSDI